MKHLTALPPPDRHAMPLPMTPPSKPPRPAKPSGGTWTFSVTLRHGDTGWDDYADGWRVVMEDGTVLGTRTLYHPHVQEQPFTRSLGDVTIPDGTTSGVHRSPHQCHDGWGARHALPVSLK